MRIVFHIRWIFSYLIQRLFVVALFEILLSSKSILAELAQFIKLGKLAKFV